MEAFIRRAPVRRTQRSSGLDKPLIVSLTSYPPRYRTLLPTLKSLLRQDMAADRIILWIAHGDFDHLPSDIRRLTRSGLEVRSCADLGPYKKFVETRRLWHDAFIVTADDDVLYTPTWLSELVAGYLSGFPAVIAFRARLIKRHEAGFAPYDHWPLIYTSNLQSDDLLPNGLGGVLYPPQSLRDESLDVDLFTRLCAKGDDLWLMWMTRRAGFTTRMVQRPREPLAWRGSEQVGLWKTGNAGMTGQNDVYLRALLDNFGYPFRGSGGPSPTYPIVCTDEEPAMSDQTGLGQ